MKRVWKIILNSMAILLLILTAATFAIWTWSRWHDDYAWIHLSERITLAITSRDGRLRLQWIKYGSPNTDTTSWHSYNVGNIPLHEWHFLENDPRFPELKFLFDHSGSLLVGWPRSDSWTGYGGSVSGFEAFESPSAESFRFLIVPHWLCPSVSAALLTVTILCRIAASRRHLHEKCANCNYDLRATPNRCPECGASPIKPT